jgi:hypothetical protein
MVLRSRRSLTVAQQFVNLKANPISAGDGSLLPGRLTWQYETSPSPLSRAYGIRIALTPRGPPSVTVEWPDLVELTGGRKLPHVYSQKPTELCLYLPGTGEWQPWMRIDQTLVPWTSLWLFYFEDWLGSDDWKGGGVHPSENDFRRSRKRDRAAGHACHAPRSH